MTGLLVPWGPRNPSGCWSRAITARKQQASSRAPWATQGSQTEASSPFQKILQLQPQSLVQVVVPLCHLQESLGTSASRFCPVSGRKFSFYEASKWLSGKGAESERGLNPHSAVVLLLGSPCYPQRSLNPILKQFCCCCHGLKVQTQQILLFFLGNTVLIFRTRALRIASWTTTKIVKLGQYCAIYYLYFQSRSRKEFLTSMLLKQIPKRRAHWCLSENAFTQADFYTCHKLFSFKLKQ